MFLPINNNKILTDYSSEIKNLKSSTAFLAGRKVSIGGKPVSLNSIIKKTKQLFKDLNKKTAIGQINYSKEDKDNILAIIEKVIALNNKEIKPNSIKTFFDKIFKHFTKFSCTHFKAKIEASEPPVEIVSD